MIIYLHGFNSSPQSGKAQHLKRYLDGKSRGVEFACPQLPHWPEKAVAVARETNRVALLERLVHWYPHLDQIESAIGREI